MTAPAVEQKRGRGEARPGSSVRWLPEPAHLVERCQQLARERPHELAFAWLRDGEVEEASLRFSELDRRARGIALELERRGLAGQRALLLFAPGLEFIPAFLGCLYARVVAVPMNPPRNERAAVTAESIVAHAQAALILTDRAGLEAPWRRASCFAAVEALATDSLAPCDAQVWNPASISPDELAILQYTTGSTGSPKGVQISHRNLIRNEQMIATGFGNGAREVYVSWLPLFHDMGLIGNILQPLYLGVPSYLMAPSAFVQQPFRWLQAMSRYRATVTGGPDFGYELCVQRVRPEQVAELDLGCWALAYNGAEPVRARTMEDFVAKFAPAGFRREAFHPCYGLAEATLYVTGGQREEPFVSLELDARALTQHRVVLAREDSPRRQTLVGCGRPQLDQRLLIVDPRTRRPLAEGLVGELWLQGSNISRGYRERQAPGRDPFQARLESGEGPFLRSGDLGFLHAGELYLTGRLKDLLIQYGQNYYPQDIEQLAGRSHRFLRVGCNAAFTVHEGGSEKIVVVQELHRRHRQPFETGGEQAQSLYTGISRGIRSAVSEAYGIHVWNIALVRHGTIPKTSSGKIQRRRCRELWLAGELARLWPSSDPRGPLGDAHS